MPTTPNSSPRRRDDKPTVIKKYANRRLYDTGRSSYVTLDDLCEMVKEGREFVVYDAKTNDDLTHAVLTQIIVEQEGRGQTLLPNAFLRQLIGFYGDKLQTLVPEYLEQSLGIFSQNQDQFREQMGKSLGDMMRDPMTALNEMNRNNMQLFQNAMRAWTTPFAAGGNAESVETLQKKVDDLQAEIERMSKKGT